MSLKAAATPFIGFLILSISYLSHDEDNDDDDAENNEDDNLTLLIGIGWNEFGWGEFAAT